MKTSYILGAFLFLILSFNNAFAADPFTFVRLSTQSDIVPNTQSGNSYVATYRLKNNTSSALTPSISANASTGDFSFSNACAGAIGANLYCDFNIYFNPTKAVSQSVQISGSLKAGSRSYPLPTSVIQTIVQNPILNASIVQNVPDPTYSGQSYFVIFSFKNVGMAPINGVSTNIAGTSFTKDATTSCPNPLTVGAECKLVGKFSPITDKEVVIGDLQATYNYKAAVSPIILKAAKTTVKPTQTPEQIKGSVIKSPAKDTLTVGDKQNITFTFTNTGKVAVTPSAVDVSGLLSPVNQCVGKSLDIGKNCTVTGTFQAEKTGAFDFITTYSYAGKQETTSTTTKVQDILVPIEGSISTGKDIPVTTIAGQVYLVEFTFKNISTTPVTGASIALQGTTFGLKSTDCKDTLESNKTCHVIGEFLPQKSGEVSNLQAVYQYGRGQSTIVKAGTTNTRLVKVEGSIAAGGDIPATTTVDKSYSVVFQFENKDDVNSMWGKPSVSGTSFVEDTKNTDCTDTLQAHKICKIVGIFRPTEALVEKKVSDLQAHYQHENPKYESQTVTASASSTAVEKAKAPKITATVTGLNPHTNIGTDSTVVFTFANEGEGDATKASAVATGKYFTPEKNTCVATLGGGSSCTITGVFHPTLSGETAINANYTFAEGDTVKVTASTKVTAPSIYISNDLPTTTQKDKDQSVIFTFENKGDGDATGASAVAAGKYFTPEKNTCVATLGGGSSCTITGVFHPTLSGETTIDASYTFTEGDTIKQSTKTNVIEPSGPVVTAQVTVPLPEKMKVDSQRDVTFVFTNTGTADSTSIKVTLIGPDGFRIPEGFDQCTGHSLASGQSCIVKGTFKPVSAGETQIGLDYQDSQGEKVSIRDKANVTTGPRIIEAAIMAPPPQQVISGKIQPSPVAFQFVNMGYLDVTPTSVDINLPGFTKTADGCSFPQMLPQNIRCKIEGVFTPPPAPGKYDWSVKYHYPGGTAAFQGTVNVLSSGSVDASVNKALPGMTPIGTNYPVIFQLKKLDGTSFEAAKFDIQQTSKGVFHGYDDFTACDKQTVCNISGTFSPTEQNSKVGNFDINLMYDGAKILSTSTELKAYSMPIEIKNNSGKDASTIYLTIKATNLAETLYGEGQKQCFIALDENGKGACAEVQSGETNSSQYGYQLSKLPKNANGNYQLYIPKVVSGRFYIGYGDKVDMQIDTKTNTIVDPNGFNFRDSNYYMLYDKFEFSHDDFGSWVNPTAVDFFSFPIYLEQPGSTSEFTKTGFKDAQNDIVNNLIKVFEEDNTPDKEWSKLFIRYSEFGGQEKDGVFLRLIAPGKAMASQDANPAHYFDQNYLKNSHYNYTDKLWEHYKDHDLYINVAEIQKLYPTFQPCGFKLVGRTVGDNFVFKCPGSSTQDTIITKPANSTPFFAGDGGTFTQPNNTPGGIIVRQLTSAFEVGLLPATDIPAGGSLDKTYFLSKKDNLGYYQLRTEWGKTGPWYDLYAKALHSIDTDPHNNPQPMYTFAYDDALAQDGTLNDPDINTEADSQRMVTVTLGRIQNELPDPYKDDTTYQVSSGLPPSNQITYYNRDTKKFVSLPTTLNGIKITPPSSSSELEGGFVVKFCSDLDVPVGGKANVETAHIYFKPGANGMIRPHVDGAEGIMIRTTDPGKVHIDFPGLRQGVTCANPPS